jgi:hypothetical protein
MADSDRYVNTRFSIVATIGDGDDKVEFRDIVSLSATFGLNSIPVASLSVATGRNMADGEPATIHAAREKLRAGDTAIITLTITPTDGATDKMESGTLTIFRGKYVGIGYKRNYNSAAYTLNLIHWLDDLNQGSMTTGNWFPGAPYDMAQNAGYYSLENVEGEAGLKMSPVPAFDIAGEIVNFNSMNSDLWGEVFYKVFKKVLDWPRPGYQGVTSEEEAAQLKPVHTALNRMVPLGGGPDPALGVPEEFYAPLGLEISGFEVNPEALVQGVTSAIAKDALNSFAYTTMWSKLIGEYAPQFFFAVAPSVDFARPIPFFAGLQTPHITIGADEYNYSDLNANMLQQIESVDLFYSALGDTGLSKGPGTDVPSGGPTFRLPIGMYPPLGEPRNIRGFKMLKELPPWLALAFPTADMAGISSGTTAGLPGTTCAPADVRVPPPPDKKARNGAAVVAQIQDTRIADNFAEHWYKTEILYQRHGELSGKLRFDISPGAIVAIETATHGLEDAGYLFASVTQVSFAIDAERGAAGTSFTLAHIRTAAENQDKHLVSKQSPLYRNSWQNAPLAKKA